MDNTLNEVLIYIENNLYNEITLDEISDAVNYSKSYISRVFNRVIGVSLPDYITKRRLSNASLMVLNTKKSLNYISDIHGFSSVKYFSTLFKRELGVSPSQYRKNTGFIYLYPKREIKGGNAEIMNDIKDLVYTITVNGDKDSESSVSIKNINEEDGTIEIEAKVDESSKGSETEITIDAK